MSCLTFTSIPLLGARHDSSGRRLKEFASRRGNRPQYFSYPALLTLSCISVRPFVYHLSHHARICPRIVVAHPYLSQILKKLLDHHLPSHPPSLSPVNHPLSLEMTQQQNLTAHTIGEETHCLSRPPTLISTDLLNPSLQLGQIQRFTAQLDARVGENGADFCKLVGISGYEVEVRGSMGRCGGGGHVLCGCCDCGKDARSEVRWRIVGHEVAI